MNAREHRKLMRRIRRSPEYRERKKQKRLIAAAVNKLLHGHRPDRHFMPWSYGPHVQQMLHDYPHFQDLSVSQLHDEVLVEGSQRDIDQLLTYLQAEERAFYHGMARSTNRP